jgi:hypothetical protein
MAAPLCDDLQRSEHREHAPMAEHTGQRTPLVPNASAARAHLPCSPEGAWPHIHPSFEGLGASSPRTGDAIRTVVALPETTLALASG